MIVRSPAALGAVIRDQRRKLGLEQRALAAKVGVSRHWIIDVEKGRPGAEIGLIFRTLRALGLELSAASPSPRETAPPVDLDAVIEAARKSRR